MNDFNYNGLLNQWQNDIGMVSCAYWNKYLYCIQPIF